MAKALPIYFFIVLLASFLSCSEQQPPPYPLPENARHLIAGDSAKTWKIAKRYNGKMRMNMGDCFLNYRQTFLADNTFHDNNADTRDCGPTLKGKWDIITSEKGTSFIKLKSAQIPELFNIEKEYKFLKILKLTPDSLTVSFKHRQFSDKTRTITDYYVREGLDVGDRYFHH